MCGEGCDICNSPLHTGLALQIGVDSWRARNRASVRRRFWPCEHQSRGGPMDVRVYGMWGASGTIESRHCWVCPQCSSVMNVFMRSVSVSLMTMFPTPLELQKIELYPLLRHDNNLKFPVCLHRSSPSCCTTDGPGMTTSTCSLLLTCTAASSLCLESSVRNDCRHDCAVFRPDTTTSTSYRKIDEEVAKLNLPALREELTSRAMWNPWGVPSAGVTPHKNPS